MGLLFVLVCPYFKENAKLRLFCVVLVISFETCDCFHFLKIKLGNGAHVKKNAHL